MVRIGINGFGRIGRVLARIALEEPDVEIVAINELDRDVSNLAYLLRFDSLYGRLDRPVSAGDGSISVAGRAIPVSAERDIRDVRWQDHGVDVIVEATGVASNVAGGRDVVARGGAHKVVVTNANPGVDLTVVIGVNEQDYRREAHHVLSSSICDANAVAPVLHELDRQWGIESGFVTTLHPWLSYQNLLDGPVSSVASPGHSWQDYSLGRASVINLIPKDTTAATAACAVLPGLAGRLEAISFRVPTHIVSASDLSICLSHPASAEDIHAAFEAASQRLPNVIRLEREALVSSDYMRTRQSCIVDSRRTKVVGGRFLKMVTWYDNEWAYSNRVLDVARLSMAGWVGAP